MTILSLTESIRKLPRIYHPGGSFYDRETLQTFDVVFPELFKDPTLPREAFPHLEIMCHALNACYRLRNGREREHVSTVYLSTAQNQRFLQAESFENDWYG